MPDFFFYTADIFPSDVYLDPVTRAPLPRPRRCAHVALLGAAITLTVAATVSTL